MFSAAGPSLFPHRKQCDWIEQGNGLMARVCDDGEVMMWHDNATRETWLPTETPPKRWRRYFKQHHNFQGALDDEFGAAVAEPGLCPPHPKVKPTPLSKVRRLQNVLRGLAKRVKDRAVSVVADGLIGPHTVAATNRALAVHAPGFTSGGLTKVQIVRTAPQIAAYLEKAPYVSTSTAVSSLPASPFVATTPPMVQPMMPAAMPGGAETMPPYYPQQPAYYPPSPGYGPPRGPGGLPTDRASVDVRAFIPAQYEHIRVSPGTGMAVVAVGVVVALLLIRDKKHKKGD